MHEDIVKARQQLQMSQAELARKAGVARARLRDLEEGRNVTLDTVRRVVAQLPNLAFNLQWAVPAPGKEAEIQQALQEIIDGATRLLRLFEAPPLPASAGDPRNERLRRLAEIIDSGGRPPLDDEH